MMRRHGETEFADRAFAVRQQARAERGVGPGLGDNPAAVSGNPFLLRRMRHRLNERLRLHAAVFEYGFDSGDPALDGRCNPGDVLESTGIVPTTT